MLMICMKPQKTQVCKVSDTKLQTFQYIIVLLTDWICKATFKLQLSVPILVLFLSFDTDLMSQCPLGLFITLSTPKHMYKRRDSHTLIQLLMFLSHLL